MFVGLNPRKMYLKIAPLGKTSHLYPVHTYHKTCFKRVLLNIFYLKPFLLKINQVLIFESIRKPCLNKTT